jgi:hypothetical protein
VSLFERLVGRQIASRVGGLESAQRTGQQRPRPFWGGSAGRRR